jgi:hypothetical protein
MRVLFRLAFVFEPLAPTAISFFLSRSLRDLQSQGLILDFRAHTTRLGRFHYKVAIEFDANEKQVHYIFNHLLPNRLKIFRRWIDV